MAKTKLEKIAGIEEQILQLENQRKLLLQKQKEDDRKARTKRLIEREVLQTAFCAYWHKRKTEKRNILLHNYAYFVWITFCSMNTLKSSKVPTVKCFGQIIIALCFPNINAY